MISSPPKVRSEQKIVVLVAKTKNAKLNLNFWELWVLTVSTPTLFSTELASTEKFTFEISKSMIELTKLVHKMQS